MGGAWPCRVSTPPISAPVPGHCHGQPDQCRSDTWHLVNYGGTLAPGGSGTPGQTIIIGGYTISNNAAVLAIDLGGTNQANAFQNGVSNYDFVVVSGGVTLGGSLDVSLLNGFVPAATNSFVILTNGGELTGGFTNLAGGRVTVPNLPGGSFLVVTTPASVVLTRLQVLLASFTASATNGRSPLTVTFTDTSAGTITNHAWNFGDGFTTNTTATNVTHTFSVDGTNLVTLTVSGSAGTNAASVVIVVAASQPPLMGGLGWSGTNLVVTGTNGTMGANYYVLSATNLSVPPTGWSILATNQFGPGGGFNFTSPAAGGQIFYRLELP